MKYTVKVGGRSFEIEVVGDEIRVDGREVVAELATIPGTPLRQLVRPDHSGVYVTQRGADGGWTITVAGEAWEAEVLDERRRALRELTGRGGAASGDRTVRAPMPGLVLRVEVAEGDGVVAGAPLLALEAMKMENEIRSPVAGHVHAVHAKAGTAVEKGAPLVEIRATDSA